MTQDPVEIYRNVSTENQFLLSSTDNPACENRAAPPCAAPTVPLDRDGLLAVYPEMKSGSLLITQSLERLDAIDLFAIGVWRMDTSGTHEPESAGLEMARLIDETCVTEGGWWGIVEPDLFIGFFPNKNDLACQVISQGLIERLTDEAAISASSGIASFPTVGFDREQILANAYKALDHAAFFGAAALVVFDDVSLNISGDHLFQQGDIPSAMEEFTAALKLEPGNVNVRNSLGVCHSLLGHFDAAVEEFETILRLAPEEFMAHYNLGLVHLLKKEHEAALPHFLNACQLSSDVYEVVLQTGRLYLDMGQPEEALRFIRKAMDINPAALAYRLSGDAHAAMRKTDEAIDAYRQAIKQNPNDAAALSALGLLYQDKGEGAEIARLFCEKSVEICPDEGKYRHQLGLLYFKQNQLEQALAAFQEAVARGFDSDEKIHEIRTLQTESTEVAE